MVYKLKPVLQGTKRVNFQTTEYKQVKGSSDWELPFLCLEKIVLSDRQVLAISTAL